MQHTYSRICVQVVFSTFRRQPLINPIWEDRLHKFITGILKNKGMIPIAVNGMEDHLHLLFFLNPQGCISDLVREVKKATNHWIREETCYEGSWRWQRGYGVFSYGVCSVDQITAYVRNQKVIHARRRYEHEFEQWLIENKIDYEKEYLFR